MKSLPVITIWMSCIVLFAVWSFEDALAGPLQDMPLRGRYAISGAIGKDQRPYHVRQGQDGSILENMAQGFSALFSAGAGLEIRHQEHHLRIRLDGVGRRNRYQYLLPGRIVCAANRMTLDHGLVREWFVNGPMGLQQGFTLNDRPGRRQEGELALTLHVAGDLSPVEMAGGRGVEFRSDDNSTVLTWSGLLVVDAAGKHLPASFKTEGHAIRIMVDDRRARYPVVVDPVFQTARLMASDGAAGDVFGKSVAIDGDIVVVGAPEHATGSHLRQGVVYVFKKNVNWQDISQQAKLTVNNGAYGDRLGSSVAIDNGVIVAGAIGVAGQGAAYVFDSRGAEWHDMTQTAKLSSLYGRIGDWFGYSVAISGDTVVVGAMMHTVSGNSEQGTACVFVKPSGGWTDMAEETADLKASDGAENEHFGRSVAIWKDDIVVGADATGPGGRNFQGAVYVFHQPDTGWANHATLTENAKLMASDGDEYDYLGHSVDIQGNTVVAGAPGFHATGQQDLGAAYVFQRSGSDWVNMEETAEFRADDAMPDDHFGSSVAIDDNTVVVGSPYHNYSGTSSNGLPFVVFNMGAVYVFEKPSGGWHDMRSGALLRSSDGEAEDHLGSSVAISGTTIVAGAPDHDINSNGDQGAAYVFQHRKQSPWPMLLSAVTSHVGRIVAGNAAAGHPTSGDTSTHRLFIGSLELWYTTSVIPHIDADMISFCYVRMPVVSDTGTLYCQTGNLRYDKTEIEGDNKMRLAASIVFNPIGTCSRSRHSCTVEPTGNGSETIWQWYRVGASWRPVPGTPVTIPVTWFDNPLYFGNMNLVDGGCDYRDVSTGGGGVYYGLCLVHRP
ncbi:FG-GAP repeat protein [Thermodesulfobacteriota bacterium B35]